jgi:hypothetical protein
MGEGSLCRPKNRTATTTKLISGAVSCENELGLVHLKDLRSRKGLNFDVKVKDIIQDPASLDILKTMFPSLDFSQCPFPVYSLC